MDFLLASALLGIELGALAYFALLIARRFHDDDDTSPT